MPQTMVLFLTIAVALVILWLGAEALVRGAASLALRAGISALAIGLTVVAFGTSAPELVVSLSAANAGATDMAIGNVVGSNICNIALILGLSALVRPAIVHPQVYRQDVPLMILVSVILVAMLATGYISQLHGGLLILGLAAFISITLWHSRTAQVEEAFKVETPTLTGSFTKDILLAIGGLLALVAGGEIFVSSAADIAVTFGVSEAIIGLTIVAVGTSLPELATSVVAAARGQSDIAVGNVVGSNIFNVLAVLGVTSLMQPLPLGNISAIDLAVMLSLAALLWLIIRKHLTITRANGALLLTIYVLYIGWLAVS